MKDQIIIGTRGSKLALWQANAVKAQLEGLGVPVEIEVIKTKGDHIQHLSFDKIEGKGFFTKEIEEALLERKIDLAVHSMKDLPTSNPEGLLIAGVSKRANPADWLVINPKAYDATKLFHLCHSGRVGTSSARRKALMKSFRPDVQLLDIRGNVPTRLKKLADGYADAIILAAAGLERLELDLSHFQLFKFNPHEFIPAPAQGVLAYQIRTDDKRVDRLIKQIHDKHTAEQVVVERKVLHLFDGGCHLPLGAYCEVDHLHHFHVFAAMATDMEKPLRRTRLSLSTKDGLAEAVVQALKESI